MKGKVTYRAHGPANIGIVQKHSPLLIIVVFVAIVMIILYFLKKNGGLAAMQMTAANPQPPVTGGQGAYNASNTGSNLLTQGMTGPRMDGKGPEWTVTVPNLTYVDRFGPGDTWTRNSDGHTFTRQASQTIESNRGQVTQATRTDSPLNPGGLAPGQPLPSITKSYNDSDWDFGSVMGDMNADGTGTPQWNATPKAMALTQMITNLQAAQQAYDDFGQYSVGKNDLYSAHLQENTDNLNRIYGIGKWPSWANISANPSNPVILIGTQGSGFDFNKLLNGVAAPVTVAPASNSGTTFTLNQVH